MASNARINSATAEAGISRASFVSATRENEDTRRESLASGLIVAPSPLKTPDIESPNMDSTVLDDEGHKKILSTKYFGLLGNYWSIGILYGSSTSLIYPVVVLLNHADNQVVAGATQLATIWWSFKFIFAFIADTFPIMGYLRKPYIFGGWALTLAVTAITALSLGDTPAVGPFIGLWSLINFCYIWAEVASDGLTVWLAQSEPIEIRGKNQTTVYFVRQVSFTIAAALTGFLLNGQTYGGPFSFELTVGQFTWLLFGLSAPVLPLVFFFLREKKGAKGESVKQMTNNFWMLLQDRPVYQVILWCILNQLASAISNNSAQNVNAVWLKFTTLDSSLQSVFQNFMMVVGMWVIQRWCLNMSWRKMIIFSALLQFVMNNMSFLLFVFGVTQSKVLMIIFSIGTQFVYTWSFMVGTLCITEVAPKGLEATTFSLVTSISNMVIPFASAISSQLCAPFKIQPSDLQTVFPCPSYGADGSLESSTGGDCAFVVTDVCWRQFYLTIIISVINLMAIPISYILPNQKKEVQALIALNQKSKLAAILIIVFTIFAESYGLLSNLFTLFPSLACTQFAGGNGC